METPILSGSHLNVTLGNHKILNDVSVSFQAGVMHAILGPNGSGKIVAWINGLGGFGNMFHEIGKHSQERDFHRASFKGRRGWMTGSLSWGSVVIHASMSKFASMALADSASGGPSSVSWPFLRMAHLSQ